MISYSKLSRARTCFLMLLVVALGVAFVAPASAAVDPQARIGLRPLTNDDVSAYKLPGTLMRSGGLDTIALGEPAYMEALVNVAIPASDVTGAVWTITRQPAGSKAVLENAPFPDSVKSFEPSVQASYLLVGRKMLRPDVPGRYTVSAAISIVGVGTVTANITLTGATYVGASVCAGCHSIGPKDTIWSMSQSWSETAHAHIFEEGMNGVASDHYGKSCLGCHTVGYDTNNSVPNGGFSSVATAINWVFPTVLKPGTFEALPAEIKNVGNIQCENCHGPGSRHVVLGGDANMISKNDDSGTCNQCHSALTHHFKGGEWVNSKHAVATSYPSGAGHEACVGCHSGTGFIDRVQGVATPRLEYHAINCMTCHEPHGRTKPEKGHFLLRTVEAVKLMDGTVIKSGGTGQLCMNCHQSRVNAAEYVPATAGSARFGPHHGPQADMLAGTNGWTYGKKIPSSAHGSVVENACVGCHMQVITSGPAFTKAGGHTFNVGTADGAIELVAACQGCHGPNLKAFDFQLLDYNDDGVIEGVQTEVQHLLDELALLLPPAGKPKTSLAPDATWTRKQLQAAFNYNFVMEDKSKGVHNTAYAVGLLEASIADLKQK